MVAFDILVNNWDRINIPAIWQNEGNPSNVMFQTPKAGLRALAGLVVSEEPCWPMLLLLLVLLLTA